MIATIISIDFSLKNGRPVAMGRPSFCRDEPRVSAGMSLEFWVAGYHLLSSSRSWSKRECLLMKR